MNKQTITFTASEQTLTKTGGIEHYASNIVSYIEASFTLGDNWAGYDSIRAVWESGYARIATVLDANNKCIVPAEVLTYKSKVNVNLVGSIVENTVLTDRLTTYPILALTVDADARVDSSETTPVTATQFEQFVDVVRDEASAIQNYTYDSEAWAVGQRAGVDVPSTDETYQNNAKYYADQGATLQQEVSDLKSDVDKIYLQSEFSIISGKYITSAGAFGADAELNIYYMPCETGYEYVVDVTGTSTTLRVGTIMSPSDTSLTEYDGISNVVHDKRITPILGKYLVVYCYPKPQSFVCRRSIPKDNEIDIANLKSNKLNRYTNHEFSNENYRINPSNGAIGYMNNQKCTAIIPCKEGQTVEVHGRTTWYQGEPINCIVAFYNSTKELITAYTKFSDSESSSTTGTLSVEAPANAEYFRAGTVNLNDSYVRLFDIDSKIAEVGDLAKDVATNTNALQLIEGKAFITANVAHSSTLDQTPVNLAQGTRFVVVANGSITSAQIYAYYKDSTSERLAIGKFFRGKASKDIGNIGIYVAQNDAVVTEVVAVKVYTDAGIYGLVTENLISKESLSQTVCNTLPSDVSAYGVSTTYATKMYNAIKEWMGYCAGDYRKIPFIVHTDQHGRLTDSKSGLFSLLSQLTQWGNVSAIFNLGDTITDHWVDDSTFSNPLLRNAELESASRCLASIPKDKQINVYGNHDSWYYGSVPTAVEGTLPTMQYNNPYFRPCGLRAKPLTDNSGNQVIYDDVFNVKYLVVASWDYADKQGSDVGYQWYWMNQAHLDAVISEMEKNDGYDLILVSHIPLQMGDAGAINPITGNAYPLDPPMYLTHYDPYLLTLWNARKNKTSGAVSSNGVSASYDFTNCDTDCLCAIAGHTHSDGVEYIADSNTGLLQIAFDYFADDTIHFGVFDRTSRKIKCWKISASDATASWEMPFDKA